MNFKIYNYSGQKFKGMIKLLKDFLPYARDVMGFDKEPIIRLLDREADKAEILGKTAFYDPVKMTVFVYTNGRHPKDIMRSIAHELVHHAQACRGDLTGLEASESGYAQKNPALRKMEKEAYLKGNMTFRDWEDRVKVQKGETEMSKKPLNEWKNEEMFSRLMERFVPASKKKLVEEVEALDEVDVIDEEEEGDLDDKNLANNTPPEKETTRGDVIAQMKHTAAKKSK